jgi:tRNA A37 threonylcarbamoyladenosine synthetase subunit TsaC/SUA5/YrdC
LLEELGEPILSTTLILPDEEWPLDDAVRIRELLEKKVELVIDGGVVGVDFTTVIDLTCEAPALIRQGKGDIAPFGIKN